MPSVQTRASPLPPRAEVGHNAAVERVPIEVSLHAANDRAADALRRRFQAAGTLVANILSSPGSGKTALLEALLPRWSAHRTAAVVVGDLATELDRDRLAATGTPAVQIVTGTLCHLEAELVDGAIGRLPDTPPDLLLIENVGNLVCPANFDLGEDLRIVLLSTTEGADKPRKYPIAFHRADLVVVTKADLLPHVDIDRQTVVDAVRSVNATAPVLEVSAKTGAGIDDLLAWLEQRLAAKRSGGNR